MHFHTTRYCHCLELKNVSESQNYLATSSQDSQKRVTITRCVCQSAAPRQQMESAIGNIQLAGFPVTRAESNSNMIERFA